MWTPSGGYKSSTGWEKSHFGGFTRIINDYPYVKVSEDIEIDADQSKATDLSWYEANKLMKMFLLCVKDHNAVDEMFVGATSEPSVKMEYIRGVGMMPKPVTIYSTVPEGMKAALAKVLKHETELAPLFAEYKEYIINSHYKMTVDDEPEENEGEGKKGKGEKGKGEKGKGSPSGKPEMSDDMCEAEGDSADSEAEGDGSPDGNHELTPEEIQARKDSPPVPMDAKEMKEAVEAFKEALKELAKSLPFGKPSGVSTPGKTTTRFKRKPQWIQIPKASTPDFVSPEMIQGGEMLLRLLDISWESDKDIVKSLRMGKIDISKIAEVPAGNVAVYQREMEEMSTRPFSVCILMDESGSMGGWYDNKHENSPGPCKYTAMHRLIKSLYVAFSQLLPPDKMFIYGHSGGSTPEIYTYHDPFNPNFIFTVGNMKTRRCRQNYDGPVIEAVHQKVREFTDDRVIFLVLSDGAPAGEGYGGHQDIQDLKRVVEKARRDEFVTVGIGIQYSAVDLYSYSTVVMDLNEMPKKVSHILNQVVKTEFQ